MGKARRVKRRDKKLKEKQFKDINWRTEYAKVPVGMESSFICEGEFQAPAIEPIDKGVMLMAEGVD